MIHIYNSKFIILFLFVFYFGSFLNAFSDQSIHLTISDSDLKILENGDTNSASIVLYKMEQIYDKEGKYPIIPAIPALIKRANAFLKIDLDEGSGEVFGDVIWALSVTGDKRVEPILLDILVDPKISSWDVAEGFLRIGKSTFPALLKKLYEVNDTKNNLNTSSKLNILVTFLKMGEFDSTGTYFNDNDKIVIKEEMLKMIKDKDENIRKLSIKSLGNFGDKSTIPILEEIMKNDSLMAKDGKYYVRIEAENAIKKIMTR
jgi:hypothetical protein